AVAPGRANWGNRGGIPQGQGARRRVARGRLWSERAADGSKAASLNSFDSRGPRTGLHKYHVWIDRRFAQTFQSRRGSARYRSRGRRRETSLAFPAKIFSKI